MIEVGLRQLLLAQPSITQIARPGVAKEVPHDAVFNDTAPQGFKATNPSDTAAWVVIREADNDPMGTLEETEGLEASTIEIDACSRSDAAARQLRKSIETFLKDYSGSAGPDDVIEAVIMGDKRYEDDFEEGSDGRIHKFIRSYLIQHHDANNSG